MGRPIFILLTLLTLLSCGSPSLRSRLQGRWEQENQPKPFQVLEFTDSYLTRYLSTTNPPAGTSTVVIDGNLYTIDFCEAFSIEDDSLVVGQDASTPPVKYNTTLYEEDKILNLQHSKTASAPLAGTFKRVSNN